MPDDLRAAAERLIKDRHSRLTSKADSPYFARSINGTGYNAGQKNNDIVAVADACLSLSQLSAPTDGDKFEAWLRERIEKYKTNVELTESDGFRNAMIARVDAYETVLRQYLSLRPVQQREADDGQAVDAIWLTGIGGKYQECGGMVSFFGPKPDRGCGDLVWIDVYPETGFTSVAFVGEDNKSHRHYPGVLTRGQLRRLLAALGSPAKDNQ